jgi:hypothetical protein
MFVIIGFSFAVAADKTGTGRVSGKIMLKDSGPVADGMVLFFSYSIGPPPLEDKYMRAPEIIAGTNSSGLFSAVLPAGKYYIGCKKHRKEEWNGPPREGDLFFVKKDEEDIPELFIVKEGDHLNIDITAEDKPYKWPHVRKEITGIEGRIHDQHGNPVEDVVVFGYLNPEMGEGLSFVSDYTGIDGRYLLRVHKGGKFYLMVMGKFGSMSMGPEMMINQGEEADEKGVSVTTGNIVSNVDIEVRMP